MANHISHELFQSWIERLQAIAQNGLTYCSNEFDIDRYRLLHQIVSEMLSKSKHSMNIEEISLHWRESRGYVTPKMDVRAAVFRGDRILMVQEKSDGAWSLPGGWLDINESPKDAVEREVLEESGFVVRATKLVALFDKLKHEHPPQIPHVCKSFFLCDLISGAAKPDKEIENIDFFPKDCLPDLSLHRVTHRQILCMFEHYNNLELPTEFD